MLNQILLIISIIITTIPYLLLLITYITNKKETNITASENILKILENEDNINFVESKDNYFSHYNIKRRIIKLTSKTYDSKTIFSQATSSLLAGYSLINNNLINYLSKIINKLKIFTIIPLISLTLTILAHNTGDCKIALIIIIITAIIEYIIYNLTETAINNIKPTKDTNKILKIFLLNTKLFFIGNLIQILRLIIIIMEIKI